MSLPPFVGRYVTGAAVGAFVAGAVALAWGDQRYARRAELEGHTAIPNVSRDEFARHEITGHPQTIDALTRVQVQLAGIQTDLAWIKVELVRRTNAAGR